MLLGGDEIRRTQKGNNNAYCQDNLLSWYDWKNQDDYSEIYDFVRKAINLRKNHPVFRRTTFFEGKAHSSNAIPDISWFASDGKTPEWNYANHFLAYRLGGNKSETKAQHDDNDFFIMCNSGTTDITVKIPVSGKNKKWHRLIDTSVSSPNDFLEDGNEEQLEVQKTYILPARTMCVLVSK